MRFAKHSVIAMSLPLALCATTPTQTDATDQTKIACEAFKVITYSRRDTDETIIQVREHNAAWAHLCGDGGQTR